MILLPDEDGLPVGAEVNALIGEALRQSVAEVEPSPGFSARLAAALDAAQGALPPAAPAPAGLDGADGREAAGRDGKALASSS